LDVIEKEGLIENAQRLGSYLREQIRSLESKKIRDVRGLGLMIGIELKEKAGPYVQMLMEKGVIALLAGATVIRLLPPLVISKEEIDMVVSALQEIL
jgi:acetylornithine/LysW-gamma-L-lysine aminotransferase